MFKIFLPVFSTHVRFGVLKMRAFFKIHIFEFWEVHASQNLLFLSFEET